MAGFTEDVRAVLDLLVGGRVLATASAWSDALASGDCVEIESSVSEREDPTRDASTSMLFNTISVVVPKLSDYKTFHENLCGLMKFCEQRSIEELFNVTTKWLASPQADPAFRRWLYAYLEGTTDRMVDVNAQKWKQALLVAALQENEPGLKTVLLKFIDRCIGSLEGAVAVPSQHKDDILRLALFCWSNADKLSQSSQLCAAKLVGLLHGGHVHSIDSVALLRWGRVLKPFFFENFVGHLRVMGAFTPAIEVGLTVSNDITKLMSETETLRSAILKRLQSTQEHISSALQRNVRHLFRSTPNTSDWPDELTAKHPSSGDRLLLDLRLDLTIIPAAVFPLVFAAYVALAISILHGKTTKADGSKSCSLCVRGFYALLLERTDSSAWLLILAALMNLDVPHISAWRDDPELFNDVVEELGEALILEVDTIKRRILQMALHHLLLQCDVQVLRAHISLLRDRLPEQTFCLVVHRVSPLERSP